MSLQSSGEISFSDIANNQNSASLQDLQLKSLSETFASGSIVDGSGAQTTARLNLDNAPYSISEFYDANFSSDEFSNIVITTAGGTSDFQTVDTENLTIAFTTTQTGTHTVELVDSSNNVDDSTTGSPSFGAVSVTFNNLNLTDDTYTPRLRLGFLTQDGTDITHHDAITMGAITTPSTTTVANASTTTNIEHQVSITNDNAFNNIDWTFTKSSGDGSAPSNLTNSTDRSPSVTYTGPGVFTISCTVDGDPLGRNSANASNNGVSHRIDYAKAVSIGNPGNVNSGGTINTSVTHQGFSSGVDVDLIRASDNAVLLSNDHTTDSRVTKVTNQNQTFIAPDQPNNTLSVKVKAFDGGNVATSNAFSIFPLLTTSKNVINPTSRTIYSTTNNNDTGTYGTSFTFGSPTNRTDNVTSRTYTEQADASSAISLSGDLTPSSQTTTQPTVSAGSNVGNATVRYTVGGNLSQTPTATDCAVSVNYMPRIYSVGTPTIAGNGTNSNQVSISYNWQGLAVASARYEVIDSESGQVGNDFNSSSPDAGGVQSQNASGTVNFTSLASSFGVSSAGTYAIRVTLFSGGSQNGSSITADSPSFTSVTATAFSLIGVGSFGGYSTLLLAAEQASSTTATKYRFGSISDDDVIYDNISTTTVFNGGSNFFNFNGEVFSINSSGVVDNLRSDTPSLPSFAQQGSSTSDDITIRITANTQVTRQFRVNVQPPTGPALENTINATLQAVAITQDISLKNDLGMSLSGGLSYAIKVQAENNHTNSGFTNTQNISTALNTSWSSVPTLSSVPFLTEETYISDVFAITLSQGTGNTTVDLGTNIGSGDGLHNALIQIAASTSDTSAGSSFTTLQAAESGGGRSQFSIAHTSGVLYFKLKVDDDLGEISSGASDDAFTMTFTNNSVPQTVSGTLREHKITSSDTASANAKMLYGEDDIVFGTVKRSDKFKITVTGCATGDQVAFTLSRTGDNFNDIQNLKMAVNTTNGTEAYNSSGVAQGTGVQETTAVSVGGTRTLTFSSLSAGTNIFTGMLRSNGDGSEPSVESTQTGNLTVKATYTNSSGNTIANQTIHTAQVQFDPGI